MYHYMMRKNTCRTYLLLILALATLVMIPNSAHATAYSIPVNGRFSRLKIELKIPSTPKWAHDVILNASLVWNRAQVWLQRVYFPMNEVYNFVESSTGNVTVSFGLPKAYAGFAVGWTQYVFAPSSTTILSAHVFLDRTIFGAEENNSTARNYAFRLALHELGHVLGLGLLLDGVDVMDPRGLDYFAILGPFISTLDLFAVHILASKNNYAAHAIELDTVEYQIRNAWTFLSIDS